MYTRRSESHAALRHTHTHTHGRAGGQQARAGTDLFRLHIQLVQRSRAPHALRGPEARAHQMRHSLTHARTHARTHSLTHLLTYSLTHLLTYSLTYSLTHSLTHSLTRSRSRTSCLRTAGAVPPLPRLHLRLAPSRGSP